MNIQTLNIALPRDLVKRADRVAKKEYRNRSDLIREALRVYLKNAEEWEKLFTYGHQQARKLGIKSETDVNRLVAEYRHGK